MQTLIIKTDDNKNAMLLANFLEGLQYVKSVVVKSNIVDEPLKEGDWIKSGRPATELEIQHLVEDMEKETEDITSAELRKEVEKWGQTVSR
jgi:hypothetical protein